MIDNQEIERITSLLETMEDEQKASLWLNEFTQAQSVWGKLLLNQDPNLSHAEWKQKCDQAQDELRAIIKKIEQACHD